MPTSGCDCFLRKIWFLHAPQPWSSISLPTCVWWDMQDGGDAKDWGTQSASDMRLYSLAIMLNLSSRNGQININIFTPVVQSSQMHKQGREPIRKCDKQSHPSALCLGVTTLRGSHSCWCTVGTQESPSVFHSVGQREHSRAHSPKSATGRKRGTEEVTGCMTESVPGEVWDNPKNQHQCDGSSARPWNHSWPTELLCDPETS